MTQMNRVAIAEGLDFSRIVYGMWRLGDAKDTSPEHIRDKIAACLDQGITTMDQADIYGGYEAEELLGAALKGSGLRGKLEIVTKCGIVAPAGRYADAKVKYYDTSPQHIAASVDHSLRLMGIDHIDLLLVHRPDPMMDAEATGRALDDAVASGKVRAVGVSNFKPHDFTLLQSAMSQKLVTNQIELSLGHLSPFTDGDLAFLQERKLPIMAWSPLGGGSLMTGKGGHGPLRTALAEIARETGVDMSAVAVAWLLAHPAHILPVMGTNTISRINALSDATKVKMDRERWFQLYTHALGHEVP